MCHKDIIIDPNLIVKNSAIRAAIPVLPLPSAIVCFVFNVFIPGSGKHLEYKCVTHDNYRLPTW